MGGRPGHWVMEKRAGCLDKRQVNGKWADLAFLGQKTASNDGNFSNSRVSHAIHSVMDKCCYTLVQVQNISIIIMLNLILGVLLCSFSDTKQPAFVIFRLKTIPQHLHQRLLHTSKHINRWGWIYLVSILKCPLLCSWVMYSPVHIALHALLYLYSKLRETEGQIPCKGVKRERIHIWDTLFGLGEPRSQPGSLTHLSPMLSVYGEWWLEFLIGGRVCP